jgi:hypothetical protein
MAQCLQLMTGSGVIRLFCSDRCVTGITVAAGILPDSDDIDGGERRTVRAEIT